MNLYTFIIAVLILILGLVCLIVVLSKCDNIKELTLEMNIKTGIKLKSLFYNRKK